MDFVSPNPEGSSYGNTVSVNGDFMVKNIDGFPMKKIKDYDITPCDVIFSMVEKPSDYLCCKSINLYDNRWRVNVYSKRMVDGIEGRYISHSYFTHFNVENGELRIIL